jgi:hypothetical protein
MILTKNCANNFTQNIATYLQIIAYLCKDIDFYNMFNSWHENCIVNKAVNKGG